MRQERHVRDEPEYFFVPPYVGPRGWLGVNLDKVLDWKRVAGLVREAYEKVAPAALSKQIGKTIAIVPPKANMSAEEHDPMPSPPAVQKLIEPLRGFAITARSPSKIRAARRTVVAERASRTFANCVPLTNRSAGPSAFWVGVEQQGPSTRGDRSAIRSHRTWATLAGSR